MSSEQVSLTDREVERGVVWRKRKSDGGDRSAEERDGTWKKGRR